MGQHQRVVAAVQKLIPAAKITIITDTKGNTNYKSVALFNLKSSSTDFTESAALSNACGSVLQLRVRCLASPAISVLEEFKFFLFFTPISQGHRNLCA